MEHIRNNSLSTIDSSYKTISVSHDFEDEVIHVPNFLKTQVNLNTFFEPKPNVNELVLQFEYEENDHLCSITQACTNCVNPDESGVIWTDFKRWANSRS